MISRAHIYLERFLGLTLRGSTLFLKSVLIFFLAKFLDPAAIGLYGLMMVTIVYCTYPLGMDFYTFSIRELIKSNKNQWGIMINNQVRLHAYLYLIFLPLFYFIFYFKFLPLNLLLWFYALIVLEHLNQELVRLLISMSKPLIASFAIFLRQGAWVFFVVSWFYWDENNRKLENVFMLWALGSLTAFVFSYVVLYKLSIFKWSGKADWDWIKKGLVKAFPLFIAMLFMNALTTVDKYWFEYLQGEEVLGAYILFSALAASLVSFLDAGIFSFTYPAMIKSVSNKEYVDFKSYVKKMGLQTIVFSLIFALFLLLIINPFLMMINKEFYMDNVNIFYILVLSILVNGLSYVPHYALYALKKDKEILLSHISGFIVFVVAALIASIWTTLYAIPIALLLAYATVLFWKLVVYFTEVKYNFTRAERA